MLRSVSTDVVERKGSQDSAYDEISSPQHLNSASASPTDDAGKRRSIARIEADEKKLADQLAKVQAEKDAAAKQLEKEQIGGSLWYSTGLRLSLRVDSSPLT